MNKIEIELKGKKQTMKIITRALRPQDVALIQSMGTEYIIYQAARISRRGNDKPTPERLKEFIGTLLSKGHGVPFEHCSVTYRLKAPIFVFRQLFRYRTAAISEQSLRYTKASPEFYLPRNINAQVKEIHENSFLCAYASYKSLLEEGVPAEQARGVLPLATFSEAYFTMNLRNLLHLFDQRCNEHAQPETRFIAERMAEIAELLFPITMAYWRQSHEV